MAEGGIMQRSFKDSISKASGEADEIFCNPCMRSDKWIAVEGYCQICDEYMCETCLNVHKQLKLTQAHPILDKTRMPRAKTPSSIQAVCADVCKKHHPEIIRFYCEDHDIPGCGDCMTLDHTNCRKKRVQDISDGFKQTQEFRNFDQHLQNLYQDLETLQEVLDDGVKNLGTNHKKILDQIKSVRKQINDYLDQIQKQITDEAAKIKKDGEMQLKAYISKHQALKSELQQMLDNLHDSKANINSSFVNTKLAKKRLVAMETEIKKMQQLQHHLYDFQISDEFSKMMSNKTPLGILSRQPTMTRPVTVNRAQTTHRPVTIDTTATYKKSINVKSPTDKRTCYILDSAVLSTDRMVVIDANNKNIKLIDTDRDRVISTFTTSGSPCRVTALSTDWIAVTLFDEGKIQLLNVTSEFTVEREIKVVKECTGIAYKDDKLAVSYNSPRRVDIMDTQGKVLHTIKPRKDKQDILNWPAFIAFGHENDTVVISDGNTHTVHVATFRGQILRSYKHDALRGPRGIALTGDGLLYVCSQGNICIHVISPDFKTSKIIINRDKHVLEPQSISYCDIRHTLYIGNYNLFHSDDERHNQVQVFKLNV